MKITYKKLDKCIFRFKIYDLEKKMASGLFWTFFITNVTVPDLPVLGIIQPLRGRVKNILALRNAWREGVP